MPLLLAFPPPLGPPPTLQEKKQFFTRRPRVQLSKEAHLLYGQDEGISGVFHLKSYSQFDICMVAGGGGGKVVRLVLVWKEVPPIQKTNTHIPELIREAHFPQKFFFFLF